MQPPANESPSTSGMLWSDFYVDHSDDDDILANPQFLASPPVPLSQPDDLVTKLGAQFDTYCTNIVNYEHVKPSFEIDLNKHAEYVQILARSLADSSKTIPLCFGFSGAGVGVERLFSGAAIQAEGRLRVLSNSALRERTLIASNRQWLD